MLAATPVAVPCHDWDGGPLTYTVESRPAVGSVVGFSDGAALYEGPTSNHARRPDSFSVRVSDGSESAVVQLSVGLEYTANGPIALRLFDTRMRMDKRGRIRLRTRCVSESKTCVARLIAYHGRPIAFGKATLPSGKVRGIRLRLPRGIRRSVRRHRKGVLVRVDASAHDPGAAAALRAGACAYSGHGQPVAERPITTRPPGEAGAAAPRGESADRARPLAVELGDQRLGESGVGVHGQHPALGEV